MNSVSIVESNITVVVENDNTIVVVEKDPQVFVEVSNAGPQGPQGTQGLGVPTGGTEGDILVRTSGGSYATAWTDSPTVDKLAFDTTATESVTTAQLAWNTTEGTLDIGTPGVTYQLGQELSFRCKNVGADPILDGEAVMFAGADAATGYLEVVHMIANGTVPGYVFFGVATEPITPGALGYVTTLGKVRGIDTSAYPEDSLLWLDPANPGGFTIVEPEAPNLKIAVAAVIKSHPTAGIIFVRAETGRNIADCHDVEVGPGAADREYLGWSEDNNRWQPLRIPNAAPRSITIPEPRAGDSFTLFRTDTTTTITSVTALVSGTNPSVTYELRYATNRTNPGVLASTSTATNTTTGSSASVANQPIPANSYVWIEITSTVGTVGEINVTIAF